jgi:hypothetical protein
MRLSDETDRTHHDIRCCSSSSRLAPDSILYFTAAPKQRPVHTRIITEGMPPGTKTRGNPPRDHLLQHFSPRHQCPTTPLHRSHPPLHLPARVYPQYLPSIIQVSTTYNQASPVHLQDINGKVHVVNVTRLFSVPPHHLRQISPFRTYRVVESVADDSTKSIRATHAQKIAPNLMHFWPFSRISSPFPRIFEVLGGFWGMQGGKSRRRGLW